MSRTNIEIDDELVERAMRMYRLESKRAAYSSRSNAWSASG